MLNEKEFTVEAAKDLLGKQGYKRSHFHKECLREYRVAKGMDARGPIPKKGDGLDDALDGDYWQ